jgi:transposase InsO family protein
LPPRTAGDVLDASPEVDQANASEDAVRDCCVELFSIPSQPLTLEVLRRPLEFTQYRSLALGKTLRDAGIMQSMGSVGDAYDNAMAESFMSTIKSELVRRHTFKSRDQARLAVFSYIEGFYNPHRRHSAIGYLSPIEYETMLEQEGRTAVAV